MADAGPSKPKPANTAKDAKRKKVNAACLYCRRSHMNCNAERPCERCVRRGIAQLCVEEGKQRDDEGQPPQPPADQTHSQSHATSYPVESQTDQPSPTASPPVLHDSFGPPVEITPTFPGPAPPASARRPPTDSLYAPPDIHQINPSPPLSEQRQALQPLETGHSQMHPYLHPDASRPKQTFARPSTSFQPLQQDVPLAPTPLETTPITSPRVWAGMEDVVMNGEPGSEQPAAVDLAGLADMFAPGQEWGSLSGFLDSLDFPLAFSNQPSPAGAANNPFSPFNVQQFGAPSPRYPQSNPTTPGGGSNPQFLNTFQTPGGGHDQRQLLAALLDAYKHRLPANIAQPNLHQNGSSDAALYPPPQPHPSSVHSQTQQHMQSYQQHPPPPLQPPPPLNLSAPQASSSISSGTAVSPYTQHAQHQARLQQQQQNNGFAHQPPIGAHVTVPPATERSFAEILQAKYESSELATAEEGWDWERGWAKLDDWMGENISQASQARIHAPLAIFRPTVRAILETLSKADKVLVEELFQRTLLNYDRIFTVVKTPSCLWRRTGEMFKANSEFASLVGINIDWFRDGHVGIYELMKEDSAVNFWEQYFQVGFDRSRKAVLTTCTLLPPPRLLVAPGKRPSVSKPPRKRSEIPCCFSFTVQRDSWGVPVVVMGQFMPIGI